MADRFTIQRVPRGVLELLGLRGSGDLPHDMAQEVRATLDIAPFYGMDLLRTVSNLNAAPGTGWNTSATVLTVPAGEIWVMQNLTTSISTGVGGACVGSFGYRRLQDNAGPIRMIGLPQINLAASQLYQQGLTFNWGQVVLTAGDSVGVTVGSITLPCTIFTGIDYYRLLF